MAESLFDQEDENQFDPQKNYLEELVGEGKKFKTVADLARGKAEADHFISFKNKEFDQLREDYLKLRAEATAQAKFEDLLTKMENKSGNDNTVTNTPVDVEPPTLDPKKIEDLVVTKLQEIEARNKEKSNMTAVENRLRERFGDSARSVLKGKMNDLGFTEEDLKFLAKKSPEAVFNALGLNQQQTETYQAPPRSGSRSDNFAPKNEQLRDLLFYEKMRKEDPKKYFSPDISVQRLKDMDSPAFLKRYQEQRST
jgi:hypothetical protein